MHPAVKMEAQETKPTNPAALNKDMKPMILAGQAAEAMAMEQDDKQELSGERFPSLPPGKQA